MVNTEAQMIEGTHGGGGSVGNAMSATAAEWSQKIGARIAGEQGLETLYHLSHLPTESGSTDLPTLLRQVERTIASRLVTELATIAGVEALHAKLKNLECRLGSLLASRARRHLNHITELPPTSSAAAHLVEMIEATSLREGVFAQEFTAQIAAISESKTALMKEIANTVDLSLTSLQGLFSADERRSITILLVKISGVVENYASIVIAATSGLSHQLHRSAEDSDKLSNAAQLEQKDLLLAQLQDHLATIGSGHSCQRARQQIAQAEPVRAILELERAIITLEASVAILKQLELSASTDLSSKRYLAGENYLYVTRLANHLIAQGENPNAVVTLADSAFEYAVKNGVSCAEVLDEEIHRFSHNVRRESLARARLDIRLSDRDFPLSVAHKDWILRIIKQY